MNEKLRATQGGFSLVEVMIATMVLTFGLLAMAASTGYISAQMNSATFDTRRSAAKQQAIERLRAMPYASLPVGADSVFTVGLFTVSSRAVYNTNDATVTLSTIGPAYRRTTGSGGNRADVTDQMSFNILRPSE